MTLQELKEVSWNGIQRNGAKTQWKKDEVSTSCAFFAPLCLSALALNSSPVVPANPKSATSKRVCVTP